MNSLSNGAPAVGSPGSIMRLISAYEYEMERSWERRQMTGNPMPFPRSSIPGKVRGMIRSAAEGHAVISDSLAAAAMACEIKPTKTAIKAYLSAAGYDRRIWY